jgi:hypothetical protein
MLLPHSDDPRAHGLRLLLLNSGLAVFCTAIFLGSLFAVSSLNALLHACGGSPSAELPFPYPLVLLLDAIVCAVAWFWFARRLPSSGSARLRAAVVGALPLFGLSLLGYASALGAFILNEFRPAMMPVANVFVLGGLSTLILLAGFVCVLLVLRVGGKSRGDAPGRA